MDSSAENDTETSAQVPTTASGFGANLVAYVKLVGARFGEDQCQRISATLTFTTLLALVPLLAIAFSILRAFPVFDGMRDRMQDLLFSNFMPESIEHVQTYLNTFIGKAGGMTAIGIVGLAVTAIMMFSTIEQSINAIFRVERPRALVPRLLMFWAVITLAPLLLGASLSLSGYLFALTQWSGVESISGVRWAMAQILPSVLAMGAFSLFYLAVPNRPVRIRHALIGGAVAAILFAVVRKLFAIYVTAFPVYQTLYGALSSIPMFLVWLFLSWTVILIGAIVCATLPLWGRPALTGVGGVTGPEERLGLSLEVLYALYERTRKAQKQPGLARRDILLKVGADGRALADVRMRLQRAHLIEVTNTRRWLLARDLDTVTVFDLFRALGFAPDAAKVAVDGPWRERLSAVMKHADAQRGEGLGVSLRELFLSQQSSRQ